MQWLIVFGLLGVVAFIAHRAYQRPRGVYLRSALVFFGVTIGWALFWLLASPSNEAGFGFFAIWVVLIALSLATSLAACIGATARHFVNGWSAHRA